MPAAGSGVDIFRILMVLELECAVPLMEENMRGKYSPIRPFKMGKHEQIMQVFTSRELQIAPMAPSQVGSCDFEATYIACRRNREVMQVLDDFKSQRDILLG